MKAFAALLPLVLLAGCGGSTAPDPITNILTVSGTNGYPGPTSFEAVASDIQTDSFGQTLSFYANNTNRRVRLVFAGAIRQGVYTSSGGDLNSAPFTDTAGGGSWDSGQIVVEADRVRFRNAYYLVIGAADNYGVTLNGSLSRSLPAPN